MTSIEIQERTTPENIRVLRDNEVFVFGSNLKGLHAGGAALTAYRHFGAVLGEGVGVQGQCYAIPTMHSDVESIRTYVDDFLTYARRHPEKTFLVTRIGCGIAGFSAQDIAPLFQQAVGYKNIHLPADFWRVLLK